MTTLVSRNISVHGRRTSLRLERTIWDALEEICRREQCSLNTLCARIKETGSEYTLTASVRVYVLAYYRAAATEEGHVRAGHGRLPDNAARGAAPKAGSSRQARSRGA